MLDQQFFDGVSEHLDALADISGGVFKVGVHLCGEQVAPAQSHGGFTPLCDLSQDNSEIGNWIFHGLLKLLQMTAGVLDSLGKNRTNLK